MHIRELEPKSLWNNFADLNAIPRPSKKEEKVIRFMLDFGEKLGLETFRDEVGNVFIRKPGSKGYEDRQTVVMQSHLDMVHQKNSGSDFNFDTQGIEMYVDGDWVKARETTLGADNGIGVATIMSILQSDDIDHPPIEALFTIDEETGMTGALQLEEGILEGKILLNLDTEDDTELTIGCAGGVDFTASRESETESVGQGLKAFQINVSGLSGGHSGMDIHKGLANANKIMNRLLWKTGEEYGVRVSEIAGGGLRNAIPRESRAVLCIPEDQVADWQEHFEQTAGDIINEFTKTDEEMEISYEETEVPEKVISLSMQKKVLSAIYSAHNGIYRMSPEIDGLVQSSNNVAKVQVDAEKCEVLCLTRSSVETEKYDVVDSLRASFEPAGFEIFLSGIYPGWTPSPQSKLVELMESVYREEFGAAPNVTAGHGGLECGIIGSHYPELDMISFGPNIKGAHSPDERCQISSVMKFWKYLLEVLKRIE